jgi:NhaP-type Na+/H+ or K+/H+ antiporter
MISDPAVQLAGLVVLAVAAGWLANRLRVPSILPLLGAGLLLGPGLGWVDPDALLGDLLNPIVGLAVGIILFEGGLTLRFAEIAKGMHRVIWSLVTIGAGVTWIIGSIAAYAFLDVGLGVAILIGAILIVSGPTVIGPVVQAVRPNRKVASILKWESIMIDPIGAMVAVIVFDVLIAGVENATLSGLVVRVGSFVLVGVVSGVVVAAGSVFVLRRHWVPEHLISLFGIAAALVAYVSADLAFHESGLISTIVLGVVLANDRRLRTEQLVRFSEILRVLLIGVLFIILSARLSRDQLGAIGWGVAGLIAVMVLVARPIATMASTVGSGLETKAKALLAGVAPRGIVAASVASLFGLRLEEVGVTGAELLVPVVFAVIIATVLLYGLGAGPLARALGLAPKSHEGVLILGAGPFEQALAEALSDVGFHVIVATINPRDARLARAKGLAVFLGNVLSFDVDLRLEMSGIGRLIALTPNDDVNTLAARRFREVFGGGEVYQLPATKPSKGVDPVDMEGRALFGSDWTYERLRELVERERRVRRTRLTAQFGREEFLSLNGDDLVILAVSRQGKLMVGAADAPTPLIDRLQPGDEVLWLPAVTSPSPSSVGGREAR